MDKLIVLKRTRRLLFGTPLLIFGMIFLGGILALVNVKHEHIGLMLAMGLLGIVGFVLPFYALGRSAALLGSSWVYFGLVPVLFIPIGPLISWLSLISKWKALKASIATQSPTQSNGN